MIAQLSRIVKAKENRPTQEGRNGFLLESGGLLFVRQTYYPRTVPIRKLRSWPHTMQAADIGPVAHVGVDQGVSEASRIGQYDRPRKLLVHRPNFRLSACTLH